jgi:tRNA pseudouridine55 synthase
LKGIINVLKPPGMTSHDVIGFMRKLLNIKKIGYAGTLDPVAAGVLPVFIGKATKAIEFFDDNYKEYVAEMLLGITTDTGDLDYKVKKQKKVEVDIDKVNKVLKSFIGRIEQVPPMYSAVHYQGKKLYELARKGITVKRLPRTVEIKSLELIQFSKNIATIKIYCSKGTYIRTLCEDIGYALNCGACLSALIRTKSGPFDIKDTITLEEMRDYIHFGNIKEVLIPIDVAMDFIPSIGIEINRYEDFFKGNHFNANYNFTKDDVGKLVRVYAKDDFLGIAEINSENNIRVIKSFC